MLPPVPTVDLDAAERDPSLLVPLDRACRDHGFFLLRNHGMAAEIEAMWQASAQFFAAPMEAKRSVMRTDQVPLGYYDRELTKRQRDLKEVFDYMRPRADGSDVNQWPADPAFRSTLVSFFDAASDVAARTLKLVYQALLADPADLSSLPEGDPRTSSVRLNYYPTADPLSEEEQHLVTQPGDMALHHHTDPGVLTLLLQDMTGGLQTLTQADGWIDVPPVEDTIVVNLGDAMQVWTNDVYRAAVHRVLPMGNAARYSTPYFFNPASKALLEPLPALSAAPPVYRAFTWREYIRGRVDDNYTDLGEDDIQISRFRTSQPRESA
ncbi:MAG: isopenicillin N synthase family dioxygenase [Pseudomonadota bacterium]